MKLVSNNITARNLFQETVTIVEQSPHKFNLTASDVADRRSFISNVKHRLAFFKKDFESCSRNSNAAGGTVSRGDKVSEKQVSL